MALKGIDIFKLTPKKNCKQCGCPTCMAFSMKVAQGALPIEKCPHMSPEALEVLSEATAPLMKTIEVGTGANAHKIGGETVLFRHEKTFVNKTLFARTIRTSMDDAQVEAVLDVVKAIDYDRVSEREYIELICVCDEGDAARFVELVERALGADRALILGTGNPAAAEAALKRCAQAKPILNGANAENLAEMSRIAAAYGVTLGVGGSNIAEIYENIKALEASGNKNLVIDVTGATAKQTFANAVQVRRGNLKDQERALGYPSIVNVGKLAGGDAHLETALSAAFTLKYGSVIIAEQMNYPEALALYALRQNIFTDPQKPMKVEPGIYPLNGADENAPLSLTVDFALTYFLVAGEYERSKCPVNLLVCDASGMSVLTAWAAGKMSAGTIKAFFDEHAIEEKVKTRTLIIPGKVAVLKDEIEAKLPGWDVVIGPMEAVQLVQFIKQFTA